MENLTLFQADQDQVEESWRRTFTQWGKGMTIEEYLDRERSLQKLEHATNKYAVWQVTVTTTVFSCNLCLLTHILSQGARFQR